MEQDVQEREADPQNRVHAQVEGPAENIASSKLKQLEASPKVVQQLGAEGTEGIASIPKQPKVPPFPDFRQQQFSKASSLLAKQA